MGFVGEVAEHCQRVVNLRQALAAGSKRSDSSRRARTFTDTNELLVLGMTQVS